MNRPWMPLYVAEYRTDTAHLNAAQHGAYLLLIMHYWSTGVLPNDDAALARIACMTPSEWKRNRGVIAGFFSGDWTHKRVDHELAKASDISEKRRKAVSERGTKRQQPANNGASNDPSNDGANADQKQSNCRSHDPSNDDQKKTRVSRDTVTVTGTRCFRS